MKNKIKKTSSINENKNSSKRTKKMREEHLIKIVQLAITNPFIARNTTDFILLVCKKLNLSYHQAKRDILEVKKREKESFRLNSKKELSKKINELAFIKEIALKQKNLNCYLGAIKTEVQLLGLEKLNIFIKKEKSEVETLENKKELFLKMIKEKTQE